MAISELGHLPNELGKRPKELHVVKQKIMHGTEITAPAPAPAKTVSVRKKRGIADMLKFVTMGVAAAVVVTVSAGSAEDDPPYIDDPYIDYPIDIEIPHPEYYYTVTYATETLQLGKGGYAMFLDIGTEAKKQVFYKYCADTVYNRLEFFKKRGKEFNNDPDTGKLLFTEYYSETGNKYLGGMSSSNIFNYGYGLNTNGEVVAVDNYGYRWNDELLFFGDQSFYDDEFLFGNLSFYDNDNAYDYNFGKAVGCADDSEIMNNYGGLTYDQTFEKISGLIDRYFAVPPGTKQWNVSGLAFETMYNTVQFSVLDGNIRLTIPEFLTVVRDDEYYGYTTITAAKNTDYFMITGSDEYPVDKMIEYKFRLLVTGDRGKQVNFLGYKAGTDPGYIDKAYMSATPFLSVGIYTQERFFDVDMTNFIRQSDPNKDTAHIYNSLKVVSLDEDTEFIVPKHTRLLPISDPYLLHRLPNDGTYTITNNGDHEVAVIGNLKFWINSEGLIFMGQSVQKRADEPDQYFNWEPLMPGESLTITTSGGLSTLTMPECCTVTDSRGTVYSASDIEIDLIKGKVK